MPGFVEGRYGDAERRRNRGLVAAVTAGGLAVLILLAALTSWPWSNAVASSALWLGFGATLWWLFASKKAGPVRLTGRASTYFRDLWG